MRWLQLILCAIALLAVAPGAANAHMAAPKMQVTASASLLSAPAQDVDGEAEHHRPCKPGPDRPDHVKCLAGFSVAALPASPSHVAPPVDAKGRHWPSTASWARGREISPPFHPPKFLTA